LAALAQAVKVAARLAAAGAMTVTSWAPPPVSATRFGLML
jgi:hypothetical protein